MRPERWRQLELLLTEALEEEQEVRDAWLERNCAGDPELLAEARSLLAVQERAEGFMETPAVSGVPRKIGPYRIRRKIASGGMGVVYEARRDGSRDRVALKVMRGQLSLDDSRLRLFQRESEALARLDHPAIARALETGSTSDGLHYFAMELVPGERLDQYIQSREPSVDERLAIFETVCDAVHHAHGRGVVHRDLKPSNILVDDRGHPKVVDFGLARLTGSDVELTTSFTDIVKIMGTLPYMSPEQARGKAWDIDARSDVYALGVVLYELLTGRLPFDFDQVLPHESLRIICEEEPRRPSSSNPALRGDLETIALKALEKEPGNRYLNVALLADDVRRFREGQEILAQPPSTIHQVRKLLLRNKVVSVALGGVMLTLAVFSGTLLIKNRELRAQTARAVSAESAASHQTELARAEARRATDVVSFLQRALEALAPDSAKGREVTVREVLDRTALGLAEELGEQPLMRAALHETIGRAYHALGHPALAEEHLRAYLELSEENIEGSRLHRAGAHSLLASALEDQGKYTAAAQELETSLSLYRELPDMDASIAPVLLGLCRVHMNLGQPERAREKMDEVRVIVARLPRVDGARSTEVALIEAELSWRAGDLAAAEQLYRKALAARIEQYGEEHTRTADVRVLLAQLLIESERLSEAQELLERGLETRTVLLGAGHHVTLATKSNLATLYLQRGRLQEAETRLLEVVEEWPEGDEHEDLATVLSTLGAVSSYLEHDWDAVTYMRRALEVYRASEGGQKDVLSNHHTNLARAEMNLGRLQQAEIQARAGLRLRRETFGDEHVKVAESLQLLAHIHQEADDRESAVELLAESVEILVAIRGEAHPEVRANRRQLDAWLAELEAATATDVAAISGGSTDDD